MSPQGLFATLVLGSLGIAMAFSPIADAQTTPNGAVTPPGTPGQFQNSPQTTNAQGGEETLKVDDHGNPIAVGRSTFAPKTNLHMNPHATAKPAKGTVHNGVYVAPRATIAPLTSSTP